MPKDVTSTAGAGSASVENGGIAKGAEIKAPWAYFDPDFNSRNAWQKYRYVAYNQFE
jgi:hypothetical protein